MMNVNRILQKLFLKVLNNVKIPEHLKECYEKLEKAKSEARANLSHIYDEIDFDSLENGILKGQFMSAEEFE